ncbi:hypothetical protein QFC20_005069 [Naganishia adeliensis]|uniref:Uncharacterized protein n=1 Tax=Naganishia adeliensis TaxID=92952 RepID=A0ACC2VTG6_9TREE|nr:hypothetical protein QFC20_005069 [Naganishia adeliensis]
MAADSRQCRIFRLAALEAWEGAEAIAPVIAGHDTVLVIERSDTGEVIGFTKYRRYSKAYPPTMPKSFPMGFNEEENAKLAIPGLEWQKTILEQYGEFLHIQNLAIAPAYQAQGLGRALMLKVIFQAQHRGLNVTLSATSGKAGFYAKSAFTQVARPIMLADGKIEGGNMMLLKVVSPDLSQDQVFAGSA